MNFMVSSPAQPGGPLVRTPIHELALVALIEDTGRSTQVDETFSRCGWFDSSLELASGLQVTEFIDVLPAGLPFEPVL
jgi:hypothetical protein